MCTLLLKLDIGILMRQHGTRLEGPMLLAGMSASSTVAIPVKKSINISAISISWVTSTLLNKIAHGFNGFLFWHDWSTHFVVNQVFCISFLSLINAHLKYCFLELRLTLVILFLLGYFLSSLLFLFDIAEKHLIFL